MFGFRSKFGGAGEGGGRRARGDPSSLWPIRLIRAYSATRASKRVWSNYFPHLHHIFFLKKKCRYRIIASTPFIIIIVIVIKHVMKNHETDVKRPQKHILRA